MDGVTTINYVYVYCLTPLYIVVVSSKL